MALNIRLVLDASMDALGVYKQNLQVSNDRIHNMDIVDLLPGDIGTSLKKPEKRLRNEMGDVDIVVAGPPCQGHSNLNNVSRRDDPRNPLYLKVTRFAEVARPKALIIENVPSVLHDRNEVVQRSEVHLRGLGYHTQSILFNTSSLGLPQTRRRHLLVATQRRVDDLRLVLCRDADEMALSSYIADIEDEWQSSSTLFHTPSIMRPENAERARYLIDNSIFDLPNSMRPPCHRDKKHSYVSMYGRLRWDKPAQTITSGFGCMGQGRFVHPSRPRVITPHEAARIQGFPDFFSFKGVAHRSALHEMVGNAVPPKVAAVVTRALIESNAL